MAIIVSGVDENTYNINPTAGIININLNNYESNYTIYSVEGKIVKQEQKITGEIIAIDFSSQAQGVYILKISDSPSVFFHKIIKQ